MAGSAAAPRPLFDMVGTPVCIVANLLAGFAVVSSPYGSVLFVGDAFGPLSVLAPLLAGLVLGLLESSIFNVRITLMAVLLPLVPLVLSVVFAFTAVAQTVGIAVGCGITFALNRHTTGRDKLG